MKALLIMLLICGVSPVFGQSNIYSSIKIQSRASVSGEEFLVDIYSLDDNIKIIHKRKDSVSSALDADTNSTIYKQKIQSVKNFTLKNDTIKLYLGKLIALTNSYTIYTSDSLLISKSDYQAYNEMLNKVFHALDEELENLSSNKDRFILDGSLIKYTLIENNQSRVVFAQSPTVQSYPLLARLLKDTLRIIKK